MDYRKDYYRILEVSSEASPEEIRSAYRRLAKMHHPDKNPDDPAAEERTKEINEAYGILSDPLLRQLYDEHRATNHTVDEPKEKERHDQYGQDGLVSPKKQTRSRTRTVKREKRIYVRGDIEVKFQGDPDIPETQPLQWEEHFTIWPTEVLVTIQASEIFTGEPPPEYSQAYATTEIFATPLQQPMRCRICAGPEEEWYHLVLYDIRVHKPVITHICRHEDHSYGTLEGILYAYTLHEYEETITDQYVECSGPTGRNEKKEENGIVYLRTEYYGRDCSTYWGEWRWQATRKTTPVRQATVAIKQTAPGNVWGCLGALLLLALIWRPLLLVVLPVLVIWLVTALAGWLLVPLWRTFRALLLLAGGVILSVGIWSLFNVHLRYPRPRTAVSDKLPVSSSTITADSGWVDTVITHQLQWQDYDKNSYSLSFSVRASAVRHSAMLHESMVEADYAQDGIAAVYKDLLRFDSTASLALVNGFDSIVRANALDKDKAAMMVVSGIQSIPYTLVIDRSCNAHYNDDFVSQYLSQCEGDCCKGYEKFGVQSPMEFMGDLKGDCDTRALVLYDVLGKLGIETALLTSNYYKHALIAVALAVNQPEPSTTFYINHRRYYLWETTDKGYKPGVIPAGVANLRYWNLALSPK